MQVHRCPLLVDETASAQLIVRTHADACYNGALMLVLAPPEAVTTVQLGESPPPRPQGAPPESLSPLTKLCDEHGALISGPLPLPELAAQAVHYVPLRMCTSAVGSLVLSAAIEYSPAVGAGAQSVSATFAFKAVRRQCPDSQDPKHERTVHPHTQLSQFSSSSSRLPRRARARAPRRKLHNFHRGRFGRRRRYNCRAACC